MITLTDEQRKVYDFILSRIRTDDQPPTIAEISDHAGSSPSLTYRRVVALEKKGYLTREGYRSLRNIRLTVVI